MVFSIWSTNSNVFPLLIDSVPEETDGTYKVYFGGKNVSDTTAEDLEFWTELCQDCSYAKEPEGFDRPSGTDESTRHRIFGILNPGVNTNKMELDIKLGKPHESFDFGVKYSCKSCGNIGEIQTFTLTVIKPFTRSFPLTP